VLAVAGNYHQPALIEEFISGQEFTVLVIGNDEPQAFPSVQIQILDQLDIGDLIYTSERVNNADIQYVCPSSITPELEQTLRDLALRAYSALDCRDFGRVDFRVDRDGVPYVLEVNPLPSLAKGDVFPLVAKACGMTYNELILKIIDIALKRQGMI
jgi:D-alanine-D-alanine ligase